MEVTQKPDQVFNGSFFHGCFIDLRLSALGEIIDAENFSRGRFIKVAVESCDKVHHNLKKTWSPYIFDLFQFPYSWEPLQFLA